MDKEEKNFLNIQSDFYHYMITEGGLAKKQVMIIFRD